MDNNCLKTEVFFAYGRGIHVAIDAESIKKKVLASVQMSFRIGRNSIDSGHPKTSNKRTKIITIINMWNFLTNATPKVESPLTHTNQLKSYFMLF